LVTCSPSVEKEVKIAVASVEKLFRMKANAPT